MKKLPDTITNESRKDVVDPFHAKFRADKLLVVNIEHKITGKKIERIQNTSYTDKHVWYEASKEVSVPDYCQDLDEVCASGIHYFLLRDMAYHWDNDQIKDALLQTWYANGQKRDERNYVNCEGQEHGPHRSWYKSGQKRDECNYVNGIIHGPDRSWYENGQMAEEYMYVNGTLHGYAQSWYENGQKEEEYTYVNGTLHGPNRSWYENGQKAYESTYVIGILHGSYRSWHQNGQIKDERMYVNGELVDPK